MSTTARPPLHRMIAAVPFVAVAAGAASAAARILGCRSVDELQESLPGWAGEFRRESPRRPPTSSDDRLRAGLEALARTGDDKPLPFAKLPRSRFRQMAPDTRRVVHQHATRQAARHPSEPVPVWLHDDPAAPR